MLWWQHNLSENSLKKNGLPHTACKTRNANKTQKKRESALQGVVKKVTQKLWWMCVQNIKKQKKHTLPSTSNKQNSYEIQSAGQDFL